MSLSVSSVALSTLVPELILIALLLSASDLSWNRIENFTAAVLTSIEETIETMYVRLSCSRALASLSHSVSSSLSFFAAASNLDYNQIASVPSTVFLDMLSNARTTVCVPFTLDSHALRHSSIVFIAVV